MATSLAYGFDELLRRAQAGDTAARDKPVDLITVWSSISAFSAA
jgi:hypothetical protein